MEFPADYQAALNGAVFYPIPEAGLLRLGGPDRRAFVQRQTTNNIHLAAAGQAQATVLTSPVGRILDVFLVVPEGEGEEETLLLHTLPGRAGSTLRYLKSRIFIMDKVSVEDLSAGYAHYLLAGPGAGAVLERAGLGPLPGENEARQAGQGATITGQPGIAGPGWRLLAPQGEVSQLEAAFEQAGAVRLSAAAYEALRIEAGLPEAGRELTEDYTPLEAGLAGVVAENKGCYTGQEVLARQVSYDKVTRQLTGLRLAAALPAGSAVFAAEGAEGPRLGQITSSAVSPRFGPVALAVLKRPHFAPGTRLLAGEAGHPVQAEACALPFS